MIPGIVSSYRRGATPPVGSLTVFNSSGMFTATVSGQYQVLIVGGGGGGGGYFAGGGGGGGRVLKTVMNFLRKAIAAAPVAPEREG